MEKRASCCLENLLELPFPLYSNATGDVKTMRRLWDKFKLPHFLIFETQEPVMVKPPDLINEGQWIDGGLYWMKSQEPPFSVSPSCPWRRVDAELPSRAESWHFITFGICSLFLDVFLWQECYQSHWSFDPAAVAFGLKPFQIQIPSRRATKGRTWMICLRLTWSMILLPRLLCIREGSINGPLSWPKNARGTLKH